MQRHRVLIVWSTVVVLTVWILCPGVSLAGAPARHYRVAVLSAGMPDAQAVEGLQEGLAQLGYVDGKNMTLMHEDTQGVVTDLVQRAARLVALGPDVLVTVGTICTAAAQQATDRVPIVFTYVGDPLHSGLIASYASSQNNLTGVSVYSSRLSAKRLELLQEVAPGLKRILAVVATRESIAESSFEVLEATARKLAIEVLRRDVTSRAEIERVLQELPPGAVDGIFHIPSTLMAVNIELLIQKATQEKLPLMVHEDSMVARGALLSYGVSFHAMGRQSARLVAKVLNGARPAEIPIQIPERLILTVNLSTARAIGLALPRSILEQADYWVE